jgi:hypothetical protein
MAIVLVRDHELDGAVQNCVKWDCSCGAERFIDFQRFKTRQSNKCPNCGCFRSFSPAIIEQLEKELKN